MTFTALISEKERLYHFYVTCNMSKEETCRAMGYYAKNDSTKISIRKLNEKLNLYTILKPKFIITFNKERGMYLKYGVKNCMKLKITCEKIKQTCLSKYGVTSYAKTKECKEKSKQTCLIRYGVESSMQSEKVKNKMKETNLERYGAENVYASEYGKQKIKETNLKRYGVVNAWQSEELMAKAKRTKLERYGDKNFNNREKAKITTLEKYGVENITQVNEIREKQIKTKLIKGTINSSSDELRIKELLLKKFPNLKCQYKSELYPFHCDFYIPELDLYIEYQGHWTHGKNSRIHEGEFDENNEKHQKILNIWKEKAKIMPMYKSAIEVWTIRDPLKRKIAKENNLNWIEFFTIDEFLTWYNII